MSELTRKGRADNQTVIRTETLQQLTVDHGRRLVQFGLVGISGVAVNTAVLYLLVQYGHLNHLIAAAISSEVSIVGNFSLNDRWTFRDSRANSSWLRRAGQYNAVAASGMVISLALLAALTLGLGIHYLLANLIALGAATLSNYALNLRFTWGVSRNPARPSVPYHVGPPLPVEVTVESL